MEAAHSKASLLVVTADCATWVSRMYMCVIGTKLTVAGSIILCGFAILAAFFLMWRSERKKAAVGRRCEAF